jgi:HTH-type transcriptional regulator/antitoxin HigA
VNIKPIRNDQDLRQALQRLEVIFQAKPKTPEFDEMEILATLIEAYENKHYPIGPAKPIDAIKFRMEQQELTILRHMKLLESKLFQSRFFS